MWIVILLFIPLFLAQKVCKQNDGCRQCSSGNDLEYQCPSDDNPHVVLHYYGTLKQVRIDCWVATDNFLEEKNIPRANLGRVNIVTTTNCGLPRKNFKTLFDKVNIKETNTLSIHNVTNVEAVLSSDLFEGLDYLEQLKITQSGNISVKDNFLTELPNLQTLDLYYSNIFINVSILPILSKFTMGTTNLEYIPTGYFRNSKQLKRLILPYNKISQIDKNSFDGAENLEILELMNNEITIIQDGSFNHMHHLYNISLIFNNITSISENTFLGHSSLFFIRLAYNKYLKLLDKAFSNMKNLTIIRLDNCNLKDLPENTFEGSINLKEIQLQNNQLESLSNKIFYSLSSLEKLNLESNSLTVINKDLFINQNMLHSLRLNNNLLTLFNVNAFSDESPITELDLSNNQLKEFYLNSDKLTNLDKINLNHNLIESLDDVVTSSISLKFIDLSYNKIKKISLETLRNQVLPNDVSYNFANNKITTIKTIDPKLNAFHMTNDSIWRIDIDVSDNLIDCSCENYEFLKNFPVIQYAKNIINIKNPDRLKCNDMNVKFIDISMIKSEIYCPIEFIMEGGYICPDDCECTFIPFNSIFKINCSNKGLTEAPKFMAPEVVNVLNKNYKIENVFVDLNHNNLENFPEENIGYENATEIYLNDNAISNVSWLPFKLKELRLDNNNLTVLSSHIIELLNTSVIEKLMLDGNPWTCNCTALKLQNYLLANSKKIESNNIRCNKTGLQLIRHHTLCRQSSQMVVVLAISITFVVVLFIAACLAASYFKWEESIKVWLYNKNLLLWFVTEEELDKDKIYDVFLSFSSKDDDFVLKTLLKTLESEPNPFKVCVHYRDWIPGEPITTQVISSVSNSRRTLVVLSNNFLESNWAKNEFRMAHTQALSDGRARVIVVILGDIEVAKLDDELKAYLRTNTYVKWGDPWFWQKLSYALPHNKIQKNKFNQKHANIMKKIDEKFDMKNVPESMPPKTLQDTNLEILPSYPLSFVSDKLKDSGFSKTN